MTRKGRPPKLDKDPREVQDPVLANRYREMVKHEALHPAWGCALYLLERKGYLTADERKMGDLYHTLWQNYRVTQAQDPDDYDSERREIWQRRIQNTKDHWTRTTTALGPGRYVLHKLIVDNEYPESEREKHIIKEALTVLKSVLGRG